MRGYVQLRARQWSLAALGLGVLFGSLPVASKLLLGSWEFEGAAQLAGLCLMLAAYLHLRARRNTKTIPDAASMLDQASQLAGQGERDRAIGLLSRAIHLDPRFWQAYQYRGRLYLERRESWSRALDDFNSAIRLAPGEAELYQLREQAQSLLIDEISSQNETV